MDHFELCSLQHAWDFYGLGNGFSTYHDFYEGVKKVLDIENEEKLGCIILKEVTFFEKPVFLSDLNISFSKYTVSGQKISSKEVHAILKAGGYKQLKQTEYENDEEWDKFSMEVIQKEGFHDEYYERNKQARQKCIEINGCKCKICGFDFEKVYGEPGKGLIHVHHVTPISSIKKEYQIDYEKDLIPVCPNCHAMIHRNKIPHTVEEVRRMIKTV